MTRLLPVLLLSVSAAALVLPVRAQVPGDPLFAAQEAVSKQDYDRAVRLLRPLAARGDKEAQFRLGQLAAAGPDSLRNPAEARLWLSRAAEQGHLEAQYQYGLLLGWPSSGPSNEAGAREWLNRAKQGGNRKAAEALTRLGQAGADAPDAGGSVVQPPASPPAARSPDVAAAPLPPPEPTVRTSPEVGRNTSRPVSPAAVPPSVVSPAGLPPVSASPPPAVQPQSSSRQTSPEVATGPTYLPDSGEKLGYPAAAQPPARQSHLPILRDSKEVSVGPNQPDALKDPMPSGAVAAVPPGSIGDLLRRGGRGSLPPLETGERVPVSPPAASAAPPPVPAAVPPLAASAPAEKAPPPSSATAATAPVSLLPGQPVASALGRAAQPAQLPPSPPPGTSGGVLPPPAEVRAPQPVVPRLQTHAPDLPQTAPVALPPSPRSEPVLPPVSQPVPQPLAQPVPQGGEMSRNPGSVPAPVPAAEAVPPAPMVETVQLKPPPVLPRPDQPLTSAPPASALPRAVPPVPALVPVDPQTAPGWQPRVVTDPGAQPALPVVQPAPPPPEARPSVTVDLSVLPPVPPPAGTPVVLHPPKSVQSASAPPLPLPQPVKPQPVALPVRTVEAKPADTVGWRVRLAVLSQENSLSGTLSAYKTKAGAYLGGQPIAVEPASPAGPWRLYLGGNFEKAEAARLCSGIKSSGLDCLVTK